MAINFFQTFNKTYYDFSGSGDNALMTNFITGINVVDTNDVISYTKYFIQNGERPDIVSNKLYGSPKYHWTFFLLNDSLKNGLRGWPMSDSEFDEMIEKEYDPYMFISGTLIGLGDSDDNAFYSSLPISFEYADDIEVYTGNEAETQFTLTDMKFVRRDFKRMGMIFTRPTSNAVLNSLQLGNDVGAKHLYFKAKNTDLGAEWLAQVEATDYRVINVGDEKYIPMEYLPVYSYSELKNSTYQFFEAGTTEDDEDKPLTHFDVISANPTSPISQRITFIEYEKIINDRKRTITVLKEKAIPDFEKAFYNLMTQ